MTRDAGRIISFNRAYGFIERRGEPDLYVSSDELRRLGSRLREGLPVTFIVHTHDRGPSAGKESACEVRLLAEETDVALLADCFRSNAKDIWLIVARRYLSQLPPDQCLTAINYKIGRAEPEYLQALLEFLPDELQLAPQACHLRKALLVRDQVTLYRKGLHLDHILEEIASNRSLDHPIWFSLRQTIVYGSRLYHFAPAYSIKRPLIQKQFADLARLIQGGLRHRATSQCGWTAQALYSQLNENDWALSQCWLSPHDVQRQQQFHAARMVSARAAEKVAFAFYQSLGHNVRDVSLTQLDPRTADWKTHDLVLDEAIPVDVKNARSPLHHTRRYVEHCVPRFKEDRLGREVIIAGVLSPYLKLENLRAPADIPFVVTPILFLGETTRSVVQALESKFQRSNLTIMIGRTVLPPWVFEYPARYYAERDRQLAQVRDCVGRSEFPTMEEFAILGQKPLPVLLAAGVPLPATWAGALPAWQKELYGRLLPTSAQSLTLPCLFLNILTHFLEMVVQPVSNGYRPEEYYNLLFSEWDTERQLPLGIHDPLRNIGEFCATLDVLWKNRAILKLHEFTYFRFKGLGLLEGKRGDNEQLETILAYCGGFVARKGKCGNSPLIAGSQQNCSHCRKLICDLCGYCSESCPLCELRMESCQEEADYFAQADCTEEQDSSSDGSLSDDEVVF